MAAVMTLALTACGRAANNENSPADSNIPSSAETPTNTDANNLNAEENVLVVYFSWSGNTEEMASYIAEQTGGDLLKIQPLEPYPTDYNECGEVALAERDNDERPEIANLPESIDQYDVILIGYPIWWGIAAWPVNGFIEANDFTAKTVIPFCTSASSGLGDSGKLLKEAAGTGNWLEGKRFSSGVSETEVSEWIQNLDY